MATASNSSPIHDNQRQDRKDFAIRLGHEKDHRFTFNKVFWTRQERKQWSAALFIGSAALYTCRTVMPLCVVSIAKDLKWDKTQSGAVLSSFFWGYCMTQILGGYLSDRIGGDLVFPVVAIFWSLLTFWTPWILTVTTDKFMTITFILTARVFLGMSQGFHFPSVASLLGKKVSDADRSSTYSIISAGSHFGTLLCGSLGSVLLERYGWHVPFYACGIGGILWLLMIRFSLLSQYRSKKGDVDLLISKEKSPSVPWFTLFKSASFWSLLIAHFCTNIAFYILLSWLPSYFHDNFPGAKGWVFNVIPWLVTVPCTIVCGWIADALISRTNNVTLIRKVMQSLSMVGMAFFLFLITFTTTYHWALFFMTCAIACSSGHNSGVSVNPQDIAPNYAGAVFGFMNMAGAIPGFVGVYMAGHILEVTQSWNAVFNHTVLISLFGWVVYLIFGTANNVTLIRKVMQSLSMVGMAFFLFLITFTTTYHWALFFMTCAIACSSGHNSGVSVNPQDIAPNYAGAVFGFMNMAGAIPGFVGVYMAGHILEVTQSWNAVFNHTVLISLFGWVVYLIFGTGKKII